MSELMSDVDVNENNLLDLPLCTIKKILESSP